jgi:hypothetical protein
MHVRRLPGLRPLPWPRGRDFGRIWRDRSVVRDARASLDLERARALASREAPRDRDASGVCGMLPNASRACPISQDCVCRYSPSVHAPRPWWVVEGRDTRASRSQASGAIWSGQAARGCVSRYSIESLGEGDDSRALGFGSRSTMAFSLSRRNIEHAGGEPDRSELYGAGAPAGPSGAPWSTTGSDQCASWVLVTSSILAAETMRENVMHDRQGPDNTVAAPGARATRS